MESLFCSRDPIGYSETLNAYSFVSANPLSRIDPSGNASIKLCFYWHMNDSLGPGAFGCMANGDQAFQQYYASTYKTQRDAAIKKYRESFDFFIKKLDQCCKKYGSHCPGKRKVEWDFHLHPSHTTQLPGEALPDERIDNMISSLPCDGGIPILITPLGGADGMAFPFPKPRIYMQPFGEVDTFAHEFGHCCNYQAPRGQWDGFSSHHKDDMNVMAIPPFADGINRGEAYVDKQWCDAVKVKY